MGNKLSELSKPGAWKFKEHVWATGLCGYVWRDKLEEDSPGAECESVKDINPLYSQEYVSALDKVAQFWIGESAGWKKRAEDAEKRIAELEVIATDYAGKFQKAQDAAKHLVIMGDSDKAEIAHLKELLATPVRLPEKFSMLLRADFHEDYHSTMAFKADEVTAAIRAAGFTVGDE